MKISGITVYRVEMPLVYPFRTAFGNDDRIESVLVRMESHGVEGWGEATPWQSPGYSAECAETAFRVVNRFLAPRVVGQEVESGDALQRIMQPIKANYFAKAALDTAWWDLYARMLKEPLYRCLGGTRAEVEVGADFGIMEDLAVLVDTIGGALDQGFKRVKLKFRPGWELEMIERVRSEFPSAVFHVDCNSAYTLDSADMLCRLDEYDLAMVEQPLQHDDLLDHAELQRRLTTPICLDESITSTYKARQAAAVRACGWINIKPGRVGGLTPAVAIHDECRARGIRCWVGGMLESALGANQCLALATLDNFTYPNDIFPSSRFYARDLCSPAAELCAPSMMRAIDAPGAAVLPDDRELELRTLESAAHED